MPAADPRPAVRAHGENLWRPSLGLRIAWLLIVIAMVAGTAYVMNDGDVSTGRSGLYVATDLGLLVTLPAMLFRWRLVLESDELLFVFFRVRRMPLSGIVDAKCVAKEGLVFVGKDGSEMGFAGLGNSAWAHRRRTPTKSDLAARSVLVAAAELRGEEPPRDFRLPPLKGVGKAAVRTGIFAFFVGLFLGD